MSVEFYQSEALKLSPDCCPASSCLDVLMRVKKVELLSLVSMYAAEICRKWPNTSRLGFIDFL